jgi:hypothetical protein
MVRVCQLREKPLTLEKLRARVGAFFLSIVCLSRFATMRAVLLLGMFLLSGLAWGEACVVHSQAERLDVKVCQQNRSIPPNLFRSGFCQPQLKGQTVAVEFVEQCPIGAYGVCRNARVGGTPYQQDVHYYGVASDATYLKAYCEQQSKGVWMAR